MQFFTLKLTWYLLVSFQAKVADNHDDMYGVHEGEEVEEKQGKYL